MTSTLEDQQQPKVSKGPLTKDEINLLTHVIFILNKHSDEKVCRHNVKMIAEEIKQFE